MQKDRQQDTAIRCLLDMQVEDVLRTSSALIERYDPKSAQDVQNCAERLVRFSDKMKSMLEPFRSWVRAEGLPLQVTSNGPCTVSVVESEKGQQSSLSVLKAGGWIACHTARDMAAGLELTSRNLGRILDHLDVKIRHCELGCFE